MSNRRIKVLISLLVYFWVGSHSQSIPVKGQANCTISFRKSSSPDDQDQIATADDSDDSFDDLTVLRRTLKSLSSVAVAGVSQARATKTGPDYSTSATLESQHIVLRL